MGQGTRKPNGQTMTQNTGKGQQELAISKAY